MKSILNIKKQHLTWLKLYLVIISALELKFNRQKKKHFSFSTKKYWFFSKFFCSISSSHFLPFKIHFLPLNESCKNSLKFERNPLSQQKSVKKRKKYYTSEDKCPQISQTSSERLKVTIQTYQMGNKELKIKIISKASCQLELI